jgi:transposase
MYFQSRPVSRLLGRKLESEEISDDRLGRALDKCYEADCNEVFASVARKALTKFGVNQRFKHLDTTSMNVQGEYEDEGIGLIKYGHSKDGRSDLKQFMISLMCSQDGDVPMLAQTIAGNTSDKTHFGEVLKEIKGQITDGEAGKYYVADSALYTQKNIQQMGKEILWISRVPEKIVEAKKLTTCISKEDMEPLENGYRFKEVCSKYGGICQRWVVAYSEKSYVRESKTLERGIDREKTEVQKKLKAIASQEFSCETDARTHIKSLAKKLKFHSLENINSTARRAKGSRGRPKNNEDVSLLYRITCDVVRDKNLISEALATKGKFIVATNELDDKELRAEEILSNYKEQQSVERGFRFLKDPLFMASSIFLKKDTRIVALSMIMCLCLLVYTLTQRKLRLLLEKSDETIPDQRGKPTIRPTMRWVYQIFEGVHVLYQRIESSVKEIVLNLNSLRLKILNILGAPYEKMYENSC